MSVTCTALEVLGSRLANNAMKSSNIGVVNLTICVMRHRESVALFVCPRGHVGIIQAPSVLLPLLGCVFRRRNA